MFLLLPFLAGVGTTGYWWWNSSKEEESTPEDKLFAILRPVLIILIGILFLRWLYLKGSALETSKA